MLYCGCLYLYNLYLCLCRLSGETCASTLPHVIVDVYIVTCRYIVATLLSIIPPPKIVSYKEALTSLKYVSIFLESKGHMQEATEIMEFSGKLTILHCKNHHAVHQTTILEYITELILVYSFHELWIVYTCILTTGYIIYPTPQFIKKYCFKMIL